MSSFSEIADFKDAKQFIAEWFTIKNNFVEKREPVNVFEVLQNPVSADEELLRGEIERLSIKGFTAKQLKTALEAIHAPTFILLPGNLARGFALRRLCACLKAFDSLSKRLQLILEPFPYVTRTINFRFCPTARLS